MIQVPVTKTILVVDDEIDLREILQNSLEMKGYRVLVADNGTDAFEIIQSQAVDFVVSDLRMSGGNGVDLLKRIRARDPKLPPVIIVSGFTDISPDEVIRLGASAFFAKPFNLRAICNAIAQT